MQLKKCSSTIKKSVQAVSMALAIGIASTASANCFLDKAVTGWTGSLTFHCDTDTDLLDNPITFDVSNGVKVSSIWGINANTRYTQTENHVEATAKLWWPDAAYILPANQAATLSFSPSNDNFAITNFHIGTDQPASKATIRITLPEKPDNISTDVKPDITIYQGSQKVVEINNRDWGAIYHQEVSFSGSSADFSVKVASINVDSGADIGKAEPASFRLSNGQTQQVTISYEQPEPKEQGKISILAVAAGGSTPIVAPNYTITKGGSIITNGQLNFSAATVVDSLDVANGYVLDTPEFIDNGTQYVPEGGETHPFSIANNQTTSVSITYDAKIIPSERLNFNVTGLPSGANTTINLVDGTNTKSIPVHGNGSYNASVLQNGDTWQISASTYNQYVANITPNSFVANTAENRIAVNYQQQLEKKSISGYWENWKEALKAPARTQNSDPAYYSQDINPYTHVFYAFLTLAKTPNPDNPPNTYWDSMAIYESMTADNVLTLMQKYPDGTPDWERIDNWQRAKIDALIQAVHQNNAKFIWAIGGWSDLQKTLRHDQIDAFITQVVDLLKLSGDGVDFDWEHLSANPDIRTEQLNTMAEMLLKLHQALATAGMQDKEVTFTTRFNSFMQDSSQYGFAKFPSDGEGFVIDQWLKSHGSSLSQVITRSNIMAYDVASNQMPNGQTWGLAVYQDVYNTFTQHLNKNQIVMGFEPGGQAAGGEWEGLQTDKSVIDMVQSTGYGGSMFWAINQPQYTSSEVTGLNADELASYSKSIFDRS